MNHKVMLEREHNYCLDGNYVEWYENSGNILKWIPYYDGHPQWYMEWFEASAPGSKTKDYAIPSHNPQNIAEKKWCGSEQQIKIKGQFKENKDTSELEKEGEWIKWNDKGEEILNVLYKDGKIKDVVDELYYDSDPLTCHEDYHLEGRDCGNCQGNVIQCAPEMVDYD
jgi:antitoxin component YwqK of YwqJK toxin-antitoxin module